MIIDRFPFFRQHDTADCGPACLRMIAKRYGESISLRRLKEISEISRIGLSVNGLSILAEKTGFRSLAIRSDFRQLHSEVPLPCIAHWMGNHYVVVYKASASKVHVADPSFGKAVYTREEFIKGWTGGASDTEEGVLLLLEPTPGFHEQEDDKDKQRFNMRFLLKYLVNYKNLIIQLFLGVIAVSILQLVFPFLTQSVVDVGIANQDMSFVYLILVAQIMLFAGRTAVDFIRNWIILHLGTRINIAVISDFLIKIMKLPMSFFERKHTGDILQRIYDHNSIEYFLTTTVIDLFFAAVTISTYGFVIALYNMQIFLIFMAGSILYFVWIFIFLEKRRTLDYKRFDHSGENTSNLIELVNGIQEIRLHNAELPRRWKWERTRARLFKVSVKSLALKQAQEGGSLFINEIKNIIITFFSARLVIEGEITLGMMMAISYMIGQLNGPILQLITMIRSVQDARISMERLEEIHSAQNEEDDHVPKVAILPETLDIRIRDLCFGYPGSPELVIRNLDLDISYGKVTAIVGASGSGKTTLMKLLLKFYTPVSGEIRVGGIHLDNIASRVWREKCGAVMQEGYIFSDTVAENVAVSGEATDRQRLLHAVHTANIRDFVDSMPLGFHTMIGRNGVGMSGGQKQRLLIARAVYKDPEFIFFDEATSALDANNEKIIMKNLDAFFKGRTAVVIAHRLSTVKNADQIVVLDQGRVIEKGTHHELAARKGAYFNLVKNQLELGNG